MLLLADLDFIFSGQSRSRLLFLFAPILGGSLVDAGNSVDNLPGESWRKARRRTESARRRFGSLPTSTLRCGIRFNNLDGRL